jgi:Tfp pilus assembly protein PilF
MLAVIYKKIGEISKAEEVYQYGIASLPTPLTLLKNYQLLLVEQHRLDEAKLIETKLQQLDDPSPYRWQRLAFLALKTGQYRDAVNYYRRAIKRAPYMHELHYQLARAYSHLGQDAESKIHLELAMNNTQNEQARALYQLKLQAYSSELRQHGSR